MKTKNIPKKIFSGFLSLIFLLTSLWVSNYAMAWIMDFNQEKHDQLISDYWFNNTDNTQWDYLNNFISWTWTWQLWIDIDQVFLYSADNKTSSQLSTDKTNLQWTYSKVVAWEATLKTISSYMKPAQCNSTDNTKPLDCTKLSKWWIWYLWMAVNWETFTDKWLYYSASKFDEQKNSTLSKLENLKTVISSKISTIDNTNMSLSSSSNISSSVNTLNTLKSTLAALWIKVDNIDVLWWAWWWAIKPWLTFSEWSGKVWTNYCAATFMDNSWKVKKYVLNNWKSCNTDWWICSAWKCLKPTNNWCKSYMDNKWNYYYWDWPMTKYSPKTITLSSTDKIENVELKEVTAATKINKDFYWFEPVANYKAEPWVHNLYFNDLAEVQNWTVLCYKWKSYANTVALWNTWDDFCKWEVNLEWYWKIFKPRNSAKSCWTNLFCWWLKCISVLTEDPLITNHWDKALAESTPCLLDETTVLKAVKEQWTCWWWKLLWWDWTIWDDIKNQVWCNKIDPKNPDAQCNICDMYEPKAVLEQWTCNWWKISWWDWKITYHQWQPWEYTFTWPYKELIDITSIKKGE